jgi:ribosomal protein S12 methylthiotransferase
VKKERLEALTAAHFAAAQRRAEERLGSVETVLLEESDGDSVLGRTRREAPEIDAVVRLPRSSARAGRFIQARLSGYDAYEFSAVPL